MTLILSQEQKDRPMTEMVLMIQIVLNQTIQPYTTIIHELFSNNKVNLLNLECYISKLLSYSSEVFQEVHNNKCATFTYLHDVKKININSNLK